MTGIKDYDAVAANNTDAPPNGAPEGMDAAAVNNIQRQQMANDKNDVVYRVPLLTDLKALDSLKQAEGSGVTLTGLTVVGTGGGVFYYDSTSSATSDDIDIVTPTDGLGRWLRQDGQFTNGTFSGIVSIDDTTDSTSTTTGSIHTDGGLGVAKDLFVGDDVDIGSISGTGSCTINSTVTNTSTLTLKNSDTTVADAQVTGAIDFFTNDASRQGVSARIFAEMSGTAGTTLLKFAAFRSDNLIENLTMSSTSTFHVDLDIEGALSKTSGSFNIEHPHPDKKDTHRLIHSFVESPNADNIYTGQVTLKSGVAKVNLDVDSRMTEGTWVLLNRNPKVFTSNETDWEPVRGSVTGNILTIECRDKTCSDTVSWMVVGERHDPHMYETNWTDNEGRVIVERHNDYLKELEDKQTVKTD